VTRGSYIHLKKNISNYVSKVKKRKSLRRTIKRLRHYNWLGCYLKRNKQTQWRCGYNNSRFPMLLEKFWYPMKCHYIKFKNKLNYQTQANVQVTSNTLKNLIVDEWDGGLDLNDFIKKI
jgi:hypothetical protein